MSTDSEWAAWGPDQQTASHWAPHVQKVLNAGLAANRVEQLARDYAAANPGDRAGRSDRELTDAALGWLDTRLPSTEENLVPLLRAIHADGTLIGTVAAYAAVDSTKPDFGDWRPGRHQAAHARLQALDAPTQADDNVGLRERAKKIAAKHRRRIASALALGVVTGSAPKAIATTVLAIAGAAAVGIALTEAVFAAGRAALAVYRSRRVARVVWRVDPRLENCPSCLENQASDPLPTGSTFPSGDTHPPIHDHCNCGLLPTLG